MVITNVVGPKEGLGPEEGLGTRDGLQFSTTIDREYS